MPVPTALLRPLALLLLLPVLSTGCTTPGASYLWDDDRIVAAFDEAIPQGATVAEARSIVEGPMQLKDAPMHYYPAESGRPQVLLVRLRYQGGWATRGFSPEVKWADVSLVFEPAERYRAAYVHRDKVVYNGSVPMFGGPTREPLEPVGRYPMGVPPPKNPLEDTSWSPASAPAG